MNSVSGLVLGSGDWRKWRQDDRNRVPPSGEYVVTIHGEHGKTEGFVRDPLGGVPAYYSTANPMKISTTLRDALSSAGSCDVDWNYVAAIWADDFQNVSATPYKGIGKIPPGHILENKDGAWKTRSYFADPEPPRLGLRDLLLEIVEERARACEPFALSLSGGFDSSLLLAALLKLGFDPPAVGLHFKTGEASEAEALEALAAKYCWRDHRIDGEEVDPSEFAWRENEHFFYSPSLTLFRPILERAKALGCKTLWTGLSADEVFVREESLLTSLLRSADVRAFVSGFRHLRRCHWSSAKLLSLILREFLPPSIVSAIAKARGRRIRHLKSMKRSPSQEELHYRVFRSGQVSFRSEQEQELADTYGLRFSYPYQDLRLIAHAMELPIRDFYRNGIDKYVLRSTFSDLLPETIAMRESRQAYDGWSLQQMLASERCIKPWAEKAIRSSHSKVPLKELTQPWSKDFLSNNLTRVLKSIYTAQIQSSGVST